MFKSIIRTFSNNVYKILKPYGGFFCEFRPLFETQVF